MIDDGSTDATAAVARAAGARVVAEAVRAARGRRRARARATRCGSRSTRAGRLPVLARRRPPQLRRRHGRPASSRRSSREPGHRAREGGYTRSFEGAPTGGGRVTELVARPLLSLLFPKLADVVQPLGGEYAAPARRARGPAVRRRVGRRARLARRRGRAVRARRRSRRSISARASIATVPSSELARAVARDHRHRAAPRRPDAFDAPDVELAARRPRRHSTPSRSRSASARRSSTIPAYRELHRLIEST